MNRDLSRLITNEGDSQHRDSAQWFDLRNQKRSSCCSDDNQLLLEMLL